MFFKNGCCFVSAQQLHGRPSLQKVSTPFLLCIILSPHLFSLALWFVLQVVGCQQSVYVVDDSIACAVITL